MSPRHAQGLSVSVILILCILAGIGGWALAQQQNEQAAEVRRDAMAALVARQQTMEARRDVDSLLFEQQREFSQEIRVMEGVIAYERQRRARLEDRVWQMQTAVMAQARAIQSLRRECAIGRR